MNEREREQSSPRPPRRRHPTGGETPSDHSRLAGMQQEADQLLRAADDAIARALSGDSEAFLRANRQHGGQ
jgi:hypothetical protein